MSDPIISPRFSLQGTLPSLLKSAGISLGAITLSIALYFALSFLFPSADLSAVMMAILTASSAWIINLLKEFVTEK